MKKLLLSLAAIAAGLFSAGAAQVTDVLTVSKIGIAGSSYQDYTYTGESGAKYALQCATSYSAIQMRSSNNNSGLVVTDSPGKVVKVEVVWNSNTTTPRILNVYGYNSKIDTPSGLYGNNAPVVAGTIENGKTTSYTFEEAFDYVGLRSSNAAMYFDSISITWDTDYEAPAVANPKISSANNTVSITCETEGAKIYYTTNGSDPTTASTEYTAPFAITSTVTVKAIAYKGSDASQIVSYTANYITSYDSFAAYIAANPVDGGTVNGPIYALYQNNINLYVKDGKGGYMLIYGNVDTTLNNGDVISFVSGKYQPYNGLPEMVSPVLGDVTSGSPINPTEVNISNITNSMLNNYIVIKNVSISNVNGRNATITDAGGNQIALYNTFNTGDNAITFPAEGSGYTITGFVGCYNSTLQITPISFEGGTPGTPDEPDITDAISVADALTIIEGLASGANQTAKVKGYITAIEEVNTSFGNATYTISDDLEGKTNSLKVYRGYWLNGDKFTDANQIQVGGQVVVEGELMNYNGNTPEIGTGNKILSYKAPEGGSTPNLPEGVLYQNDFATNFSDWTKINDDSISDFSGWKLNTSPACLICNSYYSGENHAANAKIQREFNLTDCSNVKLSFEQAFGYDFPQAQTDNYRVYVISGGYTEYLTMANFPPAPEKNWSDWVGNEFDLSEYDGSVITIGFEYATDGTISRAWELRDFILYGEGKLGGINAVDAENATPVYYNLQGVRVNNPEKGIFIVVKGDKASKVIF